uniref:GDP-fucose protein O-fucosyltransferase 2 n=1 Tax=Anthurium amnicola TaxID=1678845 RepID=A0A1D1ZFC4_9ARAE
MARQPSYSDDDEEEEEEEDHDGQALITPHNETKASPSPPLPRVASFETAQLPPRVPRHRRCRSGKKYFLAVCLPLLLVLLLYFAADVRRLFHAASAVRSGPPVEDPRVREAELRALYLLRNQQLGLLRLWNSTSNSTQISLEGFRSALLEQIKLNRQIQKSLLSSQGPAAGNTSSEEIDDSVDYLLDASGGVDVCRKVGKPVGRRTIEWKPNKDRFLLAICVSGQMSNHLICLQKHMFFAALLDRMLVLPSPKFDYQYDRVIDIDHVNKCFGRKVVISFEEFSATKKNKLQIDRFICYVASPPCFVDEEHAKRLKALGLALAKIEAAWPEDAKLSQPKKRVVGDVTGKFSCADEVLAIGDLFYADVEEEWVMQPGGPLAHNCETVIQPSRLIVLTAQRFVQTFLGSNFVALHFRRHGFLKFCNAKEESCFFPIPQAAECILRVVEKANAPVIYLSTDAAESETNILQSLLVLNDRAVPLVKRPDYDSVEKWDALLYRNHLGGDNQVLAMLDKTICAMSSVFIGSSGSTFTDDIYRLRKDLGSASLCDEILCHGEQPNYIAENE